MRRTQTSEDHQYRPAQSGDREVSPVSHDSYDPDVEWRMEETRHVVRLKVEGFNMEQLRVQANNILKEVIVSGERPQEGGRPVKFRRTIQLDGDLYKMDAIRAKLRHGLLDIILPLKQSQTLPQSPDEGEPKATTEDINRGPKQDTVASRGTSLGLAIEKNRAWRVLACVFIVGSVIGLGAVLIFRFFMI